MKRLLLLKRRRPKTTAAMEDQPGTSGGSTDMPKAKPYDSSLGTKAMKDQPGTTTGGGTDIRAQVTRSSSLSLR